MRNIIPPAFRRRGSGAILFLLCALGCHSYTGKVKSEFVKEEEVDEKVLVDEIGLETLNEPSASNPVLALKVRWAFKREYRMRKTYKTFREVLPFDPAREVMEVLSAPFLILTVLPAALVTAPVELIGGAGGDEEKDYLFPRMMLLPLQFLHPGANADCWVTRENVYGKKPTMEEAGLRSETDEEATIEERGGAAEGAEIGIEVPETGTSKVLKTDGKGVVSFPLDEKLAEISMAGKGLTLKVTVTYQGKETSTEFSVSAGELERIYEALKLK